MNRTWAAAALLALLGSAGARAQIPFDPAREAAVQDNPEPGPEIKRAPPANAGADPAAGPGGFGFPGLGGPGGILEGTPGVGASWMPSQSVKGQGTELGYIRSNITAPVPLWLDGPDKVLFTATAATTWYNGTAIFPDTKRLFPDELYNIRFGLTYMHQFENGMAAGVAGNVGSSSDKPFHSIYEVNLGVSAFLRVPSGERNSWLFTLSYQPTGELNFPLPGVAYNWVPSDSFSLNIGLPFAMVWKPADHWVVNFTYLPVRTIHSKVSWEFLPQWKAYVGFDWTSEADYLADRTDHQERLIYYEKHFQFGLRYDITNRLNAEVFGGYAFDRFYFTGHSYSDRDHDRIDLGDGPYVGARVGYRF